MMWSFFFSSRRRHTRCSRDWSSDVCSSDLRLSRTGTSAAQPAWDRMLFPRRAILTRSGNDGKIRVEGIGACSGFGCQALDLFLDFGFGFRADHVSHNLFDDVLAKLLNYRLQ